MPYYKGSVPRSELLTKIIQLLTSVPQGASEPFWTAVQSGGPTSEGYILKSRGKSGTDNIFVQFKESGYTNHIRASVIESYQPNAVQGIDGTIVNPLAVNSGIGFATSDTYKAQCPVDYWLSFDRDRIILVLKGHPSQTNPYKMLAYLGLPERLSNEADSTAACMALSNFADEVTNAADGYLGLVKVARSANKTAGVLYTMYSLTKFPTRGWGAKHLLPEIILHYTGENGARAKMTGVHPVFQSNDGLGHIKDGDEIVVGSRRFTVHQCTVSPASSSSFLSEWLAVEQFT